MLAGWKLLVTVVRVGQLYSILHIFKASCRIGFYIARQKRNKPFSKGNDMDRKNVFN